MKSLSSRLIFLFLVCLGVTLASLTGIERLKIDNDITKFLPQSDPVLTDAQDLFLNNPVTDKVILDLHFLNPQNAPNRDELIEAAEWIEQELKQSHLFLSVGIQESGQAMLGLIADIAEHLPILFNKAELESKVKPLLEAKQIEKSLAEQYSQLSDLQGIGQAHWIELDPLRFRELALARLAALIPSGNAEICKGRIVSKDSRHLLIIAEPASSATNTEFGGKINNLLSKLNVKLEANTSLKKSPLGMVHIGAYRSALDNEQIVRHDTVLALWIASIGIILLLILSLPKPLLGLLALLPAFAGTGLALFVYSLLRPGISGLTLGFGGALISIAVDCGIAFFLFLIRPYETNGWEASRNARATGFLATVTTVGAFLSLLLSGFPILGQIGLFAALGVGLSFILVHTVFPPLFPEKMVSKRKAIVPLERILNRLAGPRSPVFVGIALAFIVIMAFFAKPEFKAELNAMNTVSSGTLQAEKTITEVWGDIFAKVHWMAEGGSVEELRQKGDRIADFMSSELRSGALAEGFALSSIIPGEKRAESNFRDWRAFWTSERINQVQNAVNQAASEVGFAPGSFDAFFAQLSAVSMKPFPPSAALYDMLGIAKSRNPGKWVLSGSVKPGTAYDPPAFRERAGAAGLKLFDASYYSKHLSEILADTFLRMFALIGISVIVLLAFFLFDWSLVLIALAPLVFAFIASLGTMKLIGRPVDIPGLMLSIVVFGMGIDYSLYFVRAYQRFGSEAHPALGPARATAFLAAGTTMIGMLSMALADHNALKSAGIAGFLGITFSLIGTFVFSPPLLRRLFKTRPFGSNTLEPGSPTHRRQVENRFRHLEAYPRLFAYFKIRLDPMFPALARLIGTPKTLLDVGCGYGIPAVWLKAINPDMNVITLDPDPERIRIAARVLGEKDETITIAAPHIPPLPCPADSALFIDIAHWLTEKELIETFTNISEQLAPNGRLLIRVTIPSSQSFPWARWTEQLRLRLHGKKARFRSLPEMIQLVKAGRLEIDQTEAAAPGREETWIVAHVLKR